MARYRIVTDSSCDLTQEMADEMNMKITPLAVRFRGKEYRNYLDGRELDVKEFYQGLRDGEPTSTTAANPELWKQIIEPALKDGEDVLVLAFSSGLSATCTTACLAADELREQYPERKIYVVDTLCASLGQGMLCWLVNRKKEEGATLEEARDYAENTKLHLAHWFTVDDLFFLKRGGRISGATAVMGTMLQIKPVLHVDDAGKLISVGKARGRKASIQAMAAKVGEDAIEPEKQVMFICHGDCLEDAEYLAKLVQEQYHVPEIHINHVGPVIGSHSGPGTLAVFFLAQHR